MVSKRVPYSRDPASTQLAVKKLYLIFRISANQCYSNDALTSHGSDVIEKHNQSSDGSQPGQYLYCLRCVQSGY